MSEGRRARFGWASLAFGLVAAIAYVAQRLLEIRSATPVDPLLVIREAHTAYYWRCATAIWWGGVAFAVVARGSADGFGLPRFAAWWFGALGITLLLSTWWWP
ncbi:MAG: hypothetical protein MUE69_04255 [Myxococcota bacterium]|nr:hypothetical protein [Myxococcota bacterium]